MLDLENLSGSIAVLGVLFGILLIYIDSALPNTHFSEGGTVILAIGVICLIVYFIIRYRGVHNYFCLFVPLLISVRLLGRPRCTIQRLVGGALCLVSSG